MNFSPMWVEYIFGMPHIKDENYHFNYVSPLLHIISNFWSSFKCTIYLIRMNRATLRLRRSKGIFNDKNIPFAPSTFASSHSYHIVDALHFDLKIWWEEFSHWTKNFKIEVAPLSCYNIFFSFRSYSINAIKRNNFTTSSIFYIWCVCV